MYSKEKEKFNEKDYELRDLISYFYEGDDLVSGGIDYLENKKDNLLLLRLHCGDRKFEFCDKDTKELRSEIEIFMNIAKSFCEIEEE